MANLEDNNSIGWYGTGPCDDCSDFLLYESNGDLKSGMENVVSITQVKEGGYVYTSWSAAHDQKQRTVWDGLPTQVKTATDKIVWIKDGQGITELKCGVPYVVKIIEGTSMEIEDFHLAGLGNPDAGRVIECVECPTYPDCICEE